MNMEYIAARFDTAEVRPSPFPHLVVENVFPDSIYREMEACLPSYFRWLASFVCNRLREPMFGIRDGNPSTPLLAGFSQTWKRFEPFVSQMDRLTIEKFSPYIARYFDQLAGLLKSVPTPRLGQSVFCQRSTGWTSSPHTHDLGQIIQSMVYFPLPGSTEDMGTVLYDFDDREVAAASLLKTARYRTGVVKAMTLPYRANTLVSFLNTPVSVHGARAHNQPRRYIFTGTGLDSFHIEGVVNTAVFRAANPTPS